MDNATTAKSAKRVLATRETQQLVMVRCITKVIGARKFTFWQAEDCEMHIGRGCHMKAMSDAVRSAPVKVVTGKVVQR